MKIKTKLLLVLSALPLLILFLAGIGWRQNVILTNLSSSLNENYETAFLAEQIHRKRKNGAIYLRNMAIFTDDQSVQREIALVQAESKSLTQDIAILESMVDSAEQKRMVQDVERTDEEFNRYKDEVIRLVTEGKKEEAIALINDHGHNILEQFSEVIFVLTTDLEDQMESSLSNVTREFQRTMAMGGLFALLGVLFVTGFLYRSVWAVAVRLNKVSGVMTAVADGSADLSTQIPVKSHDEIDDVARSFNRMAQSLMEQKEKEQDEHWLKSNMAEITAILTGAHDLESVARVFLSKAVPLVEASHAVFYVKETEEHHQEPLLKLMASYAFKERKHLVNTFRIGEGLIGQAAFENSPILLTSVPPDYIRIRSGLGEAPPLNVYVLPVSFKGNVLGVVEMAAFKPFTPVQQAFLEEMVNNLGITLDSVMSRMKLAKLLEEAQVMAEELQAQSEELQSQQEELRAINEELEEQTLALRQSEEKLQTQQEELEQTNAELKEKAEYLEIQNKRFEATNKEMEIARLELEEKARQLALSSKYKSEFLANMSHELRTPLNSLLILSKLLADNTGGNLTEKQIEYSKTIYSSGSDLLSLINDILDLAKIESGKMDVNPSDVQIADLAEFAEKSFRPIANEQNLQFDIVLQEGLPGTIYSDERRLQQVIRNLLSNAFKFTQQGEVVLEIGIAEGKGNRPVFSFSITDTGIGIPEDKQELIFEAFQQADGTTSRKFGGTGLGLSICREMAALLGGEIVVKSFEGKGSTFTFYVGEYSDGGKIRNRSLCVDEVAAAKEEAAAVIAEPAPQKPLPQLHSGSNIRRLLIVDDDLKQRNSLMELIGEKDVIITAVSTGAEAVEQLKVNQFDFLVLDLGLADTTGYELLEQIQTDGLNDHLKVFIYTGCDLTSKEEIQLRKYAHTIIIKDGHSPQRLMDELELFLSSAAGDPDPYAHAALESFKQQTGLTGKRILLVDDDVRNVFALSSVFEMYGMNVTFAENGVEALDLLGKGFSFDIVLTDIMMPEMDGYETIRRLRRMPGFERLPVIALTAKAMGEDREKCMEVGASDYIVKPVEPDQLISLIRVWLYPERESHA